MRDCVRLSVFSCCVGLCLDPHLQPVGFGKWRRSVFGKAQFIFSLDSWKCFRVFFSVFYRWLRMQLKLYTLYTTCEIFLRETLNISIWNILHYFRLNLSLNLNLNPKHPFQTKTNLNSTFEKKQFYKLYCFSPKNSNNHHHHPLEKKH